MNCKFCGCDYGMEDVAPDAEHSVRECRTILANFLERANLQNGEWVDFAGALVQKIHDLQHTGSSPLCQQPSCKAFFEKLPTEKPLNVIAMPCGCDSNGGKCSSHREPRSAYTPNLDYPGKPIEKRNDEVVICGACGKELPKEHDLGPCPFKNATKRVGEQQKCLCNGGPATGCPLHPSMGLI